VKRLNTRVATHLRLAIYFCVFFSVSTKADTLITKDGQRFEGRLIGMEGGYISLQETKSASASLAIHRFDTEETAHIEFSDKEQRIAAAEIYGNQHYADAIPLLESLVFRRLPFLGILQQKDEEVFSSLLLSYSASSLYDRCLGRHKLWHRKLAHHKTSKDSSIAAMRSAWAAGYRDEAALFAQRWIDAGYSSKQSAIAWRILAELAEEKDNYEDALWISLQPIAFADAKPIDQLAECFAITLAAAKRLGKDDYIARLSEEATARGLKISPRNATPPNTALPKPNRSLPLQPNPNKLLGNP